ncbi:MAG: glutamate 5-kinase [Thermoleophilia bacterium]|nr:glutamate 5-kinase [Thermoleophilia bacterium]
MSDVIVIKIGSSTLVDEDGALREQVLSQRVAEVARLRAAGMHPVLVTSGAIACGLGRLGVRDRPTALPDLQAASAVGQGVLFARYIASFHLHGVVPGQVLLTSADLEHRASYLNARNTLERLLAFGVVPVINENDTTATDELTFGDNDVLAAQVAILLRARVLVLLTDRDGLYGPGEHGPVLITDVAEGTDPADVVLADLPGAGNGRGGVASKVASASMATACGVVCIVASGTEEGVITRAAAGEAVGTRFRPSGRAEGAFKLWLRHAKPSQGRVCVDAGAADAITRKGTSLLPVGVVSCEGTFTAGDAVTVVGPNGHDVGKGIVDMSADEIRRVQGMRSEQVSEVLPGGACEVIHRDRLALVGDETGRGDDGAIA